MNFELWTMDENVNFHMWQRWIVLMPGNMTSYQYNIIIHKIIHKWLVDFDILIIIFLQLPFRNMDT